MSSLLFLQNDSKITARYLNIQNWPRTNIGPNWKTKPIGSMQILTLVWTVRFLSTKLKKPNHPTIYTDNRCMDKNSLTIWTTYTMMKFAKNHTRLFDHCVKNKIAFLIQLKSINNLRQNMVPQTTPRKYNKL